MEKITDMGDSKKRNTVLFIIVATIANVALMVFFFLLGIIGLSFILPKVSNPDAVSMYGTLAVIIVSLVLSWALYSAFIKRYVKKHNVEDSFAPVFGSKKNGGSNVRQR